MGSAAAGSASGIHAPGRRRDSQRRGGSDAHARRGSRASVRCTDGAGSRASGRRTGGGHCCEPRRTSGIGQWRGVKCGRTASGLGVARAYAEPGGAHAARWRYGNRAA